MKLFLFHIRYHNYTVIIRAQSLDEASTLCLEYLMHGDVNFDFNEEDFYGIKPIEISSVGDSGLVYSDAPPL